MKTIFSFIFALNSFTLGMNTNGPQTDLQIRDNFYSNINYNFCLNLMNEEEITSFVHHKKNEDIFEYFINEDPDKECHAESFFVHPEVMLKEDKMFLDSLENNYSHFQIEEPKDLFDYITYFIIKASYDYKNSKNSDQNKSQYSDELEKFINKSIKPLTTKNIHVNSLKDLNDYMNLFFKSRIVLNSGILKSLFNALAIALKADVVFSFKTKEFVTKHGFKDNIRFLITDDRWDLLYGSEILIGNM